VRVIESVVRVGRPHHQRQHGRHRTRTGTAG